MTGAELLAQAKLLANEPSAADAGHWTDDEWELILNKYRNDLLSRLLRGSEGARAIVLQVLQADLQLTQDDTDSWIFYWSGTLYPWGRKSITSLMKTGGTDPEDWRQKGVPGVQVPQSRWREYAQGYAGETVEGNQPLWDWEQYDPTTIANNKLRIAADLSLDDAESTEYMWVEFVQAPGDIDVGGEEEVSQGSHGAVPEDAQGALAARAAGLCMRQLGLPGWQDLAQEFEGYILTTGGARV